MQLQQNELIRVTLKALQTSKERLKSQLDEVDRAINYQESLLSYSEISKEEEKLSSPLLKADLRKSPSIGAKATKDIILDIFDEEKRPLKVTEVQGLYGSKTHSKSNIKEFMRKMQKRGDLKIMKINNSNRNSFWIKPDWIEDGQLKDEYRESLQVLYNIDEITFV